MIRHRLCSLGWNVTEVLLCSFHCFFSGSTWWWWAWLVVVVLITWLRKFICQVFFHYKTTFHFPSLIKAFLRDRYFQTIQKLYFSSYFHLSFSIHWYFMHELIITVMMLNTNFLVPIISTLLVGILLWGNFEDLLSIYLLIYWFMSVKTYRFLFSLRYYVLHNYTIKSKFKITKDVK